MQSETVVGGATHDGMPFVDNQAEVPPMGRIELPSETSAGGTAIAVRPPACVRMKWMCSLFHGEHTAHAFGLRRCHAPGCCPLCCVAALCCV